ITRAPQRNVAGPSSSALQCLRRESIPRVRRSVTSIGITNALHAHISYTFDHKRCRFASLFVPGVCSRTDVTYEMWLTPYAQWFPPAEPRSRRAAGRGSAPGFWAAGLLSRRCVDGAAESTVAARVLFDGCPQGTTVDVGPQHVLEDHL